MADRIDTAAKAMKAATAYAVAYDLAGQPSRQELVPRYYTVLALCQPGDHGIRPLAARLRIRTLMSFDPYRGPKVISVGHMGQDDRPYCPRDARSVATP